MKILTDMERIMGTPWLNDRDKFLEMQNRIIGKKNINFGSGLARTLSEHIDLH